MLTTTTIDILDILIASFYCRSARTECRVCSYILQMNVDYVNAPEEFSCMVFIMNLSKFIAIFNLEKKNVFGKKIGDIGEKLGIKLYRLHLTVSNVDVYIPSC